MLKRFILWDYPRASWQYDVMVGLLLAFIFLTPRYWFGDQPRMPRAGKITMLPSESGTYVFWVDPELLAGVPLHQGQGATRLAQILKDHTGQRKLRITRVEPIRDSENEVKGYMAFARQ